MTLLERLPPGLGASDLPLCSVFDLAILDLDGVVYIGEHAVPGAAEAIASAAQAGLRPCYLTNNASRTPEAVAEHLVSLGVQACAADVVTSAQVAAELLAERFPAGTRVLVIGGEGLTVALTAAGLAPVSTVDDHPQAVVQGFSPDLNWRMLAEAARAVRAGLPWVASNLDLTVPTPFGPAPGNGCLVRTVATAAGRDPDQVAGKPMPEPFLEAARRHGAQRPLVVGDRLDTDLEGARAAGMAGLAVLTGVSTAADLVTAPPHLRPTYIGADLGSLLEAHPEVAVDVDEERSAVVGACGQTRLTWSAARTGPELAIDAAGEPLEFLRAACSAAWGWADLTGSPVDSTPVTAALRRLDPGLPWAR